MVIFDWWKVTSESGFKEKKSVGRMCSAGKAAAGRLIWPSEIRLMMKIYKYIWNNLISFVLYVVALEQTHL